MSVRRLKWRGPRFALLGPVLTWLALTPAAVGQPFEKHFSLTGDELLLVNLIGEVRVEGTRGSSFEADVVVRGEDASQELIQFETAEGEQAKLIVKFPIEEERRYVYPEMDDDGSTSFSWPKGQSRKGLKGLIQGLGRLKKIRVTDSGDGLEVWADVTLRVPRGKRVTILHAVGANTATEVEGDIAFDLNHGDVTASEVQGKIDVDTGNGTVALAHVKGPVQVDTGNGHVELEEIDGEIAIDTGNGGVTIVGCSSDEIDIDTGNGGVQVQEIDCRQLRIDTGSGRVRAREIRADDVNIDTGSGSVDLSLDRMGGGRFRVDTGSGSIDLTLPLDASAEITADTGAGSITTDLGADRVRLSSGDRASFRIGDGEARVVLDTGSGSISIRQ